MRFPLAAIRPLLALLPLLAACTAAEQTAETAAPSVGNTATPTAVNSDADRRAIYESNGGTTGAQPVPDATPNTLRLGEEAAGTGARQRVGNLNTNDPNTTTPETHLQRIEYDAPQPEVHSDPKGTPLGQSPDPR